MDAIDVGEELDAYRLLKGDARRVVGNRLLRTGTQIRERMKTIDKWLTRGDEVLAGKPNREREDSWIEKLHEYERLGDMLGAIEAEVLSGEQAV